MHALRCLMSVKIFLHCLCVFFSEVFKSSWLNISKTKNCFVGPLRITNVKCCLKLIKYAYLFRHFSTFLSPYLSPFPAVPARVAVPSAAAPQAPVRPAAPAPQTPARPTPAPLTAPVRLAPASQAVPRQNVPLPGQAFTAFNPLAQVYS